MGGNQRKLCPEYVQGSCSAALARPIHHPDTRRVISWELGNTAATRGISMKGRRIITSPFNIHTQHTHTATQLNPAHCARFYWQLNLVCMSNLVRGPSFLILRPHWRHVAQPIRPMPFTTTAALPSERTCMRNRTATCTPWNKTPSQGNFRLLEIQSSYGANLAR